MKKKIRNWLRGFILTDEERGIVDKSKELESSINVLENDVSLFIRALDNADVVGDGAVLEDVDILVVMGDDSLVNGCDFGGSIYIRGSKAGLTNNIARGEQK